MAKTPIAVEKMKPAKAPTQQTLADIDAEIQKLQALKRAKVEAELQPMKDEVMEMWATLKAKAEDIKLSEAGWVEPWSIRAARLDMTVKGWLSSNGSATADTIADQLTDLDKTKLVAMLAKRSGGKKSLFTYDDKTKTYSVKVK
jgi:hypothetical protein